MPIHIRAGPEELAPVALLVGDPARATRIAERLDRANCYNNHRGLLGYRGEHRGFPIAVQTTGMGGPSAAIVVEELADLGVRTVIRLGTCGAIAESVDVADVVIATAAVPLDGATRQYLDGKPFAPVADFAVTQALVTASGSLDRRVHVGLMMSHDVFYDQVEDWAGWRRNGVLAVEMEAAAVFTAALRRGLRAGAACLVVDQVQDRSTWADEEIIAAATEELIDLGLEASLILKS